VGNNESCCTSIEVDGGSFLRGYDGVFDTNNSNPATVSSFALDKYEVTVGRFRPFVAAWDAGWRPRDGAGVHTHLNQGRGLADVSAPGTFEHGWSSGYDATLPATAFDWDNYLACNGSNSTWSGADDQLPINCVDWFAGYAFCIWDGGFLPSEAEWEYTAMGGGDGSGQRVYAWSAPSTSATIDCTYANYDVCGFRPIRVGALPNGIGRWGHLDLTGNLWEWSLDYFEASFVTPCVDGAFLSTTTAGHICRGGSWNYKATEIYVGAARAMVADGVRYGNDGIRCARPAR
jgi:formylglycine-generating enzyme required for sulfatase activity